jgi:hypothetical protein
MARPSHLSSTTAQTSSGWTELAMREGDGLEISLCWSKSANQVKVSVLDQRLQESFDIHVAATQALSAFHHPFAYASGQGICFGDALREAADLQPQT